MKILLFILRFTYGFNRKTAELSNSFISNGTGIHEITVSKEVNSLLRDNVIKLYRKPSFHTSRIIGINKNYESWSNHIELAKALTVSKKSLRVSENAQNRVSVEANQEKKTEERQNSKKEKERAVLSDDVFSDAKIQYNDDGTYIDEKGYPRLPNGEIDEDKLTPQQKLELRIF